MEWIAGLVAILATITIFEQRRERRRAERQIERMRHQAPRDEGSGLLRPSAIELRATTELKRASRLRYRVWLSLWSHGSTDVRHDAPNHRRHITDVLGWGEVAFQLDPATACVVLSEAGDQRVTDLSARIATVGRPGSMEPGRLCVVA